MALNCPTGFGAIFYIDAIFQHRCKFSKLRYHHRSFLRPRSHTPAHPHQELNNSSICGTVNAILYTFVTNVVGGVKLLVSHTAKRCKQHKHCQHSFLAGTKKASKAHRTLRVYPRCWKLFNSTNKQKGFILDIEGYWGIPNTDRFN